jgi:hypothetical protein
MKIFINHFSIFWLCGTVSTNKQLDDTVANRQGYGSHIFPDSGELVVANIGSYVSLSIPNRH